MNFNGLPATAMGTEGLDEDSNINALDLPYDQWVSLPISGLKPSARYKVITEASSVSFFHLTIISLNFDFLLFLLL